MPRKRSIPDEALLDAALLLVRASGPDALTFGALADRVDLAASTLVQRFGTKPAMLRAALGRAWDRLDADTATAIAAATPGPRGVVELLVRLSGQYDAEAFADQLLLLREDLRDPVLRARGEAWISVLAATIDRLLGGTAPDGSGLGELFVAQWQGTLTVWSFTRRAPLDETVRDALTALAVRLGLASGPA
jgi:AcrR family transcriptional regulator